MKVLIIANARSGRGRGVRAAEEARAWLESSEGGSHSVVVKSGGPGTDSAEIERAASDAGVIVVAGGDGSVHHAAIVAMKTGVPIYHLPCGNENLFAREFGMTASKKTLSGALARGRRAAIDMGRIAPDGAPDGHFVLMVSFGPDASVVHRLAASRTRATGHLVYTKPIIAEFLRPHLPRLSLWVDGEPVVTERRGVLVAANCRQYAFRVDPCHRASMTDGKLDYVFLPCEGRWAALAWGWRCRKRKAEACGAVAGIGRELRVRAAERVPYQLDGEAGAGLVQELRLRVEPGALSALDAR